MKQKQNKNTQENQELKKKLHVILLFRGYYNIIPKILAIAYYITNLYLNSKPVGNLKEVRKPNTTPHSQAQIRPILAQPEGG